jgi:quercetin dioxygenase-like cupin family protein
MNLVPAVPKFDFIIDGTVIRTYHVNNGEGLPKHEHVFQHATQCHAGKLAIRKEGIYVELTKDSQPVILKENEWHEIEALEDNTVFCNIFAEGKY